jgi:hypothetical protein
MLFSICDCIIEVTRILKFDTIYNMNIMHHQFIYKLKVKVNVLISNNERNNIKNKFDKSKLVKYDLFYLDKFNVVHKEKIEKLFRIIMYN